MTTALILGAAVWPGGASPALRRRTAHAATLWHAGTVTRLIACGGLGRHPPTEAAAMRDLLVALGVPPDVIATEDASRSTAENIANAIPYLQPGERDILIVTDRNHAPRARLVARRLGLRARSDCPVRGTLTPGLMRQYLREIPGLLYYAATCWPRRRTPRSGPKGDVNHS